MSIGLVAVGEEGTITGEKEIFCLPDKESAWPDPKIGSWTTKINKMNVSMRGRCRYLFRLGEKLPAVTEFEAAKEFKHFLDRHGVTKLIFHGEDQKCIRPFFEKHNILLEDITMHSTVCFFTLLEQKRIGNFHPFVVRTKLERMVEVYASDEAKKRYNADKHSALTDAVTLYSIVFSSDLKVNFKNWLSTRVGTL